MGTPGIRILGILNVTPDSFSDGGDHSTVDAAVTRAWEIAEEGANALDVGGESTRPGSDPVSEEEELRRVLPVLEALGSDYPLPVSVDTRRAVVARAAADRGATLLNDTSALRDDPNLASLAANRGLQVILMHRQGTPKTMQDEPRYRDLVGEVRAFFQERVEFAVAAGISQDSLILDPGLGFGKRRQQNYELVARLPELTWGGFPVMIGASRKSFLAHHDGGPPRDRLAGSLAFAAFAVARGARWLRVHDVRETRAHLAILEELQRGASTRASEEIPS